MEVKIDIIDKLYKEIDEMCSLNSISVEDYIVNLVMDNYYTLKWGDLNEKLNKKEEKKETEKKKPGRPRKQKDETPKVETKVTESLSDPIETANIKKVVEEAPEELSENDKLKRKLTRTRILKAK